MQAVAQYQRRFQPSSRLLYCPKCKLDYCSELIVSHSPTDWACFLAFITLAVQSAFYLSPLGQPLVAKSSHRDILLHVEVLQIDCPCDILTPSVTTLKSGRRTKAVGED